MSSQSSEFDFVVIGGGIVGCFAAFALKRWGEKVCVVEPNLKPDKENYTGSWGESRILRVAYSDPLLVQLMRRSFQILDSLQEREGSRDAWPLYEPAGMLTSYEDPKKLEEAGEVYRSLGIPFSILSPSEVWKRWNGRVRTFSPSLLLEEGCAIGYAERTREALFGALDQEMLEGEVLRVDRSRKEVVVKRKGGERKLRYRKAVLVTSGVWTNKVLKSAGLRLLPLLASIEQYSYHLPRGGGRLSYYRPSPAMGGAEIKSVRTSRGLREDFPLVLHNFEKSGRPSCYMIPATDKGGRGVKGAVHSDGELLADHDNFIIDPEQVNQETIRASSLPHSRKELRRDSLTSQRDPHLDSVFQGYVSTTFPQLQPAPSETGRCLYCNVVLPKEMAERSFLVGSHPEDRQVLVACGFSGEGFKFSASVGELIALLAVKPSGGGRGLEGAFAKVYAEAAASFSLDRLPVFRQRGTKRDSRL